MTECDLDLRVGGRFNTVFEVDGQRMDNKGVFLEIDPGKKRVFTDGYTEGWGIVLNQLVAYVKGLKR